MTHRFSQNPLLTTRDIQPSHPDLVVECVLNPGVFSFAGKTWLLLRVAERPVQKPATISFPVMQPDGSLKIFEFDKQDTGLDLSDARIIQYQGKSYLTTISHLRLVCSDDGVHFYEPADFPTKIFGQSNLETFGIEDCRVALINDVFHLTYTQVSEHGVGVGLIRTQDWQSFEREGMILPPHNKDCCLFEEKINGRYYCLHRPSGVGLGGNFIWLASSPDLLHWGNHQCIAHPREGMWDSARIGAGAAPIRTDEGWLIIYHGATAEHRYCLGAILLDLHQPSVVLARSIEPLMEPVAQYETTGFFGNVVFTNGHLVDGDTITMYYGASDEVICGATLSIKAVLDNLRTGQKSR
jgi:beta-1,2-mannobiose phosphorylase / 1,2-beta-oligomannan phosphorylase